MIIFRSSFRDKGAKQKISKVIEIAQEAVSVQIAKDSNRFIPKDYGNLEASVFADSDFQAGRIVWGVEYAVYVYYKRSLNLSKDKNPQASHLWFEVAKSRYLADWLEVGQNVVNQKI
ncbi:hypothetical protein CBF34_07060 [Vagococcus penaei]|uniref:minor capsid protein n=1 Tax=Vagococcus penaei TaxID=633807 RepID=UPI000F89C6EF|nr:minor capsid protein [Vagococcus penaei]RSU01411.1 hypothetical protein CBF34_07060 [Vagococcus penaei]